jgi:hypothetical protein
LEDELVDVVLDGKFDGKMLGVIIFTGTTVGDRVIGIGFDVGRIEGKGFDVGYNVGTLLL